MFRLGLFVGDCYFVYDVVLSDWVDDVLIGEYVVEDVVFVVELGCWYVGDEELIIVCVGVGVCYGEYVWCIVV